MSNDDLDTLRPEVRAAMIRLESYLHITIGGKHFRSEDYDTIRAELLRLANENADLQLRKEVDIEQSVEDHKWHCDEEDRLRDRAERAEAELAALKARIAQSCRAYHSSFENTLDASTLYARAVGIPGEETYALVKMEE